MDSDRTRFLKRSRSNDSLDRRVDQWIETGRQFVDGVSGTRPGKRRTSRFSASSFETMGRWVEDKLDWLLEDDDSWREPWKSEPKFMESRKKRPLEAVSRRSLNLTKSLPPNNDLSRESLDEWPSESTFRVSRWKRSDLEEINSQSVTSNQEISQNSDTYRRPLPKSSRRRF